MISDVAACSVLLLCILVIHWSLQGEASNMVANIEQQRKEAGVGNAGALESTLGKEYSRLEGKAFLPHSAKVKPPTYNVPPDEVVRRDREWNYLDSPLNQIPIPRAPTPTFGEVTPRPQVWHREDTFFPVLRNRNITVHGPSNYILQKAVSRYETLIGSCTKLSIHPRRYISRKYNDTEVDQNLTCMARRNFRSARLKPSYPQYYAVESLEKHFSQFPGYLAKANSKMAISHIHLGVRRLGGPWPNSEMNESYLLIAIPSGIKILAEEVWGAIRGLETLSQLLWCSPSGSTIFINQTFIRDYPSFPHRGLHLDTSRHYISKHKILMNLETMAFNKLNVFHWHVTDDQSFPFVSRTFPELSKQAAYNSKMVYTHDDVREIVEFARVRGIRVIPEFDIPGHTRSWSLSHPEIFAKCYDMENESPFYGGLDPSKNETLEFLAALFKEIVELFPDSTLHMGFDEVEFNCWSSNPAIKKFMLDNGMVSPIDIFKIFTVRLLNRIQEAAKRVTLTGQRRFIFWQEVFDNGLKVPNNSLIHLWKDLNSIPGYFGFQAIVSKGWYLDSYLKPSEWIGYYENEIYPSSHFYPDVNANFEPKNVIGGEACMWIEWQSEETVIQRIWPVTSAIAERLWYYRTPNPDEFGPRLEEQRCRLLRRGVPVGVASGPGMCPLPSGPDGDISPFDLIKIGAIGTITSGEYIHHLEIRKILLLIFCGLALFTAGYFAGRQGLAAHLSRVLKTLSTNNFGITRTSRLARFRTYTFNALFICFSTFIAILLLVSSTPHTSGLVGSSSLG